MRNVGRCLWCGRVGPETCEGCAVLHRQVSIDPVVAVRMATSMLAGGVSSCFYDREGYPIDPMTVVLQFGRPRGATRKAVLKYIREELACGGGCRHPDDPLHDSLRVYAHDVSSVARRKNQ